MRPIVFHDEAREEYREAIRYYYGIDPDLQAAFRAEVGRYLRMIADNPGLFNVRRYDVRRANLKRFGLYYIAYMLWKERSSLWRLGTFENVRITGVDAPRITATLIDGRGRGLWRARGAFWNDLILWSFAQLGDVRKRWRTGALQDAIAYLTPLPERAAGLEGRPWRSVS